MMAGTSLRSGAGGKRKKEAEKRRPLEALPTNIKNSLFWRRKRAEKEEEPVRSRNRKA